MEREICYSNSFVNLLLKWAFLKERLVTFSILKALFQRNSSANHGTVGADIWFVLRVPGSNRSSIYDTR